MLIFQYECLPTAAEAGKDDNQKGQVQETNRPAENSETSAHCVIRHTSLGAAPTAVPVSTHRLGNKMRSRQRQFGTEESNAKYCFKTPLDVSIKHT